MHRNIVGRSEKRVEIHALHAGGLEHFGLGERVKGNHLDAECLRFGRDQPRNVTETDETEHSAFDAADRYDCRHFPAAGLHQLVGQGNFSDQRQEKGHGMVGYFPDAVIRYVVDRDAFLLGGGQIDIVDTQPKPAYGPAAGQLHEHIARKLGVGHKNRVGVLGNGNNIFGVDALGHPIGRIEPRQCRLGRIE